MAKAKPTSRGRVLCKSNSVWCKPGVGELEVPVPRVMTLLLPLPKVRVDIFLLLLYLQGGYSLGAK